MLSIILGVHQAMYLIASVTCIRYVCYKLNLFYMLLIVFLSSGHTVGKSVFSADYQGPLGKILLVDKSVRAASGSGHLAHCCGAGPLFFGGIRNYRGG